MKYVIFVILAFLLALSGLNAGFENSVNPIRVLLEIIGVIGIVSVVIWGRIEKKGGNYKPWFWTSVGTIFAWLLVIFTLG